MALSGMELTDSGKSERRSTNIAVTLDVELRGGQHEWR